MSDVSRRTKSAETIRDWLVAAAGTHLNVPPGEVELDVPLIAQGIDSMQFVVVIGELEDWLGCRFADNPLVRYPTIRLVAEFLERQLAEGRTVIHSADD
ncbi:MAG: acyl carrier protein [Planctomycetaceae bacterium]